MNWFPIFMNLQDAPCLVVGGGEVALRKTRQLLDFGARVSIASPELHEALGLLVQGGRVRHAAGAFAPHLLDGCTLAIAATDDREVNRQVRAAARGRRVPVNVVDDPSHCDFILPAIVERGPVTVAISTGGTAPVLARQLKAWLELRLPRHLGSIARVAGSLRARVQRQLASPLARRRFWERVLDQAVEAGDGARSDADVRRLMESALDGSGAAQPPGVVHLVGAGPGDPDLLTLRAFRLMQGADVILHDELVSDELLALARRDAERIAVGRRCGAHRMAQSDVNALMVKLASEGKQVLRLKGGDPMLFGRCGEEMEALADAGIPFDVVPGVTAASGCAADAAIPLTHRDHAHACVAISGHRAAGETDVRWPPYANGGQTLAVYMGQRSLASISRALRLRGWPSTTPAALVAQGTLPGSRVLAGTLADLPETVERERPPTPGLLIVGDVVALHHKLAPARQGRGAPVPADTNPPAALAGAAEPEPMRHAG